MKLQLDTTVQIHGLLNPPTDQVNSELDALIQQAEMVSVSTYSKKEFGFSLIKDLCTMLARVSRKKSLKDALSFIDTYGSYKKRFRGRLLAVFWRFFITETIRGKLQDCSIRERDRILAEEFSKFLRVCIPEWWERFGNRARQPLEDRTKCPFAGKPPEDNGETFDYSTRKKCSPTFGCALPNLMKGEGKRALKLLEVLRKLKNGEKTGELKKIEATLEDFFQKDNKAICYEMCNQGIGDLIIALETHVDRTLITTNAKESDIISPAIGQKHIVLKLHLKN